MDKLGLFNSIGALHESGAGLTAIIEVVEKFLESNVCIPKGKNRHPCADVLHEWAEDITKDIQRFIPLQGWESDRNLHLIPLRFKPSEPVYEWQWILEMPFLGEIARTKYMTDSEFEDVNEGNEVYAFKKDESTKRERV